MGFKVVRLDGGCSGRARHERQHLKVSGSCAHPLSLAPGICRRVLLFILSRKALIRVPDLHFVLHIGWDEGPQLFTCFLVWRWTPDPAGQVMEGKPHGQARHQAQAGPMTAFLGSSDSEWPQVWNREAVTYRPGVF